jgi:hypothetical protein
MKRKQYHTSAMVCLVCPDCKEKVCGISLAHAKAVMKQHKEGSILHKGIVHALEVAKENSHLQIETLKGVATK